MLTPGSGKGPLEVFAVLCDRLGGHFGCFLFFVLFRGREKEEESEAKRGGYFLFRNREGGRVFEEGRWGGAPRGSEGVAGRGGG